MTRAGDILRNFDDADQRLAAHRRKRRARRRASNTAGSSTRLTACGAVETARQPWPRGPATIVLNFEEADKRLAARVGETARRWPDAQLEIGHVFDARRPAGCRSRRRDRASTLGTRHPRSATSSRRPISGWPPASAKAPRRSARMPPSIANAFAKTEQRVVAGRSRLTGRNWTLAPAPSRRRWPAPTRKLAPAPKRAAGRRGADRQRGKPPRLQRENDRPEAQRAGLAGRGAARLARQRHRRNLHGGRPAYRPEHQRGGAHHRRQHARAQCDARRAFGRDHRKSSTRRRVRWSSASPKAATNLQRASTRSTDTRHREAARRKRSARQRARQPHGRNAVGRRRRASTASPTASPTSSTGMSSIEFAARRADRAGAASTSANVDERLTGSTRSFAATTEKAAQTFASSARLVDSNTTRLTELSSSTLARGRRRSRPGSTSTAGCCRARRTCSSSAQSNLEHTLERQSSLEDLAVGLVKKSEDLETRHAVVRESGRPDAGKGRGQDPAIDGQDPYGDHRSRRIRRPSASPTPPRRCGAPQARSRANSTVPAPSSRRA